MYAELPHDPPGTHDSGKEKTVTHSVQRRAKGNESFRCRAKHVLKSVAPSQRMTGGQIKPAPSYCVIIRNIWTTVPSSARGDIIREEPGEPECVVAQMCHDLKASLAIAGVEVCQDIHQVDMLLVIMSGDAERTLSFAEGEHQRREIIGQVTVIEVRCAQEMAHRYIEKQPFARRQHGAHRHELIEEVWRIEERIGTVLGKPMLQLATTLPGTPAQHRQHQVDITRLQTTAQIGTDHGFVSRKSSAR